MSEQPSFPGPPQSWLRRLATGFVVRLRHRALDRALADGVDPLVSASLSRRAAQLTSGERRRRLAASLESLVEAAERTEFTLSAAITPQRDAVLIARPRLIALTQRLRSEFPVGVRGMAILVGLLTDGASPFYSGDQPEELSHRLETVLAYLDD